MKKVFSAEKYKAWAGCPSDEALPLWAKGADGQEVIDGRVGVREPYNRYTDEVVVLDDWCGWLADDEGDNLKDEPEDVINHPKHYCREGGMESIDEMVEVFGREAVMNFCLCNIWKYRYRASGKNGEEDLKKSDWYMRKYKELKEESK